MAKVTFNGINKLIIINNGITSIDVKIDLYSYYKEWVMLSDNTKYLSAFSAIGGDPLPGGTYLGSTFFLENGWKIRPYEGNHTLTIDGNLYSRDGLSPFVSTIGNFNVTINLSTSNLVDTVNLSGTALTETDLNNIKNTVWQKLISEFSSDSSGSIGNLLIKTEKKVDDSVVLSLST